ncbi:electron transport complex protein RnfE|uniref:Ion-translocating oxidoreductase complex subunit E n=1 Tax=Brenneria salicis ATCC 15712 = DSM 30166 TaxID=714314 RepID=A0A366I9S9_9GAMM|nr:electron transport complex subunit E [Brenneria salicis]NMN91736.1 electron transport complex protein RnfE [Brenneria salicis ATCC 15712 = DSM 30166]RBP65794.1 electron transport complex protein RnfE [Brenneria salicis ATCC 15712 = DSM 30166]RLM31833.1 electron transport complex subunit RsxE [Brenneria salicis ATCC 15712 = DSM 30166]
MSEITATAPVDRPAYRAILVSGIWTNNITYVQILGLCPLMAVTTTATNGFGMGVMTTAVLAGANLLVSLLRSLTPNQIRIPVYILIISSLVTVLDLTMNAWMHDLHKILGLFIPLIVANCALLGRAESFAAHNPPFAATLDGMATGLGFTLGLTSMGAIREIIGSGTLFSGAEQLLGPTFRFLEMHLLPNYDGFILMLLPPGGFVVMGFVLAGIRGIKVLRYGADVLKKEASTGCGAGCGGCR